MAAMSATEQSAAHRIGLVDVVRALPAMALDAPSLLHGAIGLATIGPTSRDSVGHVFQRAAHRHPDRPFLRFEDTERVRLSEVTRRMSLRPVDIDADIEELLSLAIDQNFVPVVDGRQAFIGIVRRRSVLVFFGDRMSAALREPAEETVEPRA